MNSLKRLIPYLKPYKGAIIAAILLGMLANGLFLGTARLAKIVFDQIMGQQKTEWLYTAPLALVVLMLLVGIFRFLNMFLLRYTGEKVAVGIRSAIHEKFLTLGLDFHSKNQGGSLISRTINDVNYIQQGLALFADVVKEPINVLMILGYLFYVDWKLTLACLIAIPIVAYASDRLGKSVRRSSFKMQENFEEFTSALKETLDGIRVVKAFNLEPKLRNRVHKINTEYLGIRKKILSREEVSGPLFEFLAAIIAAGILIYTGTEVIKGHLTAGDILSFFFAAGLLQPPVKKLQDANVRIQHTIASTERIFAILDSEVLISDPPAPKKFPEEWKEIEFQDVHFNYGSRPILKGINLKVKRGEVVALVGASGAGKSTFVNLIPRFHDVTDGQVLIGGEDVRQFTLHDLRDHIALVTQDVFLFNESIEDNIRGVQPLSTTDQVELAAKAAHAQDFILRTKEGFRTKVGDRGLNLSGGERQRISIARAVYKNAPILILDEATSSLDSHSEQEVQKALDELMMGRTTFVIAHRLSTVQRADRILVMRDGLIVEQGTHEQLINRGGEYKKLYSIQFQ